MLLALLLSLSLAAQAVSGVVKDSSGGAVSGAAVLIQTPEGVEQQTVTGPDGRFTFDTTPTGEATIVVRAGGFGEARHSLSAESEISIVLTPAALLETVIVTATRTEQRLGNVAASVNVMTRDDIQTSAAVMADDVLKRIPTFSLFRRTSAIAAQPTTQGVSLRGIGPSGQSRTLVLFDGIPFNDPFGGWVYWTRVPLDNVDRVEVIDGPSSGLYGNYGMGGVINIVSARPTRQTVEFTPQFGAFSNNGEDRPSSHTKKADFFGSDVWGKLGVAVNASWFNTDGFPIVAPRERGPIDNNANVNYNNVTTKVDYTPTDRTNLFFRAARFSEDRINGKVGEVNDTVWSSANGGVRMQLPDNSDLQARLFVDHENSHFNFLAVTNPGTTRNVVRLATDQLVPTNGIGWMAQWTKALGMTNAFSAGVDSRWVDGDSEESAYVPSVPTAIVGVTQAATLSVQRVSGGTQQSLGAYLQDIFTPTSKLVVTLGARVDRWRNYDGHNREITVATGLPTVNNRDTIPDRSDTVVSPRASALYHISDRVTGWASINSGFRAPTLTELYRQFSVGAVVTRPNDQLGPERLVGGEAGINVAPVRNLTVRATWFDNRIRNPVSNVTLTATLAQKQNLGRTRVRGLQTDAEYRLGSSWRMAVAYLYDDAKVTDGGVANAALVGKFLAQVPKHRGSAQIAYSNPKLVNIALNVQFTGAQFNDDQNVNFIPVATLTDAGYDASTPAGLPGFKTVDLSASRDIGRNFQVFAGLQNMLDQVYFVQTNPSTIGTPRLINGGVRVRWAGR